jgi:hypothetical protein
MIRNISFFTLIERQTIKSDRSRDSDLINLLYYKWHVNLTLMSIQNASRILRDSADNGTLVMSDSV